MNGFWTVRRAAAAVGLNVADDRPLAGVSTDTRSLKPGDLFVALRGERFDGHDFLRGAVESGAGAVVVDDGSRAAGVGVAVLVVPDTLRALGALGCYLRTAWSRTVVAIGGSNGKTTTKDLVRAALDARFPVHATTGNLNNRIGVPMTLLGVTEAADIAVIEVGTNRPGEIALLRDITKPNIAVITNIQEEHLEGFGDLAGVMAEEMSLLDGVELAVVPAIDPGVVAEARKRAASVVTAGLEMGDVRANGWGLGPDGLGWLRLGQTTVRVPAPGAHNLANAMLAIAVARACGVADADIATGIAGASLQPMRSAVEALGQAVLVNDAYNANPGSMRAALKLVESVAVGRPMVLLLGTMRELGDRSDAHHDEIARLAAATPAVVIGAVGAFADAFQRVAPGDERVVVAAEPGALWPSLSQRLPSNAAILLKGSRGVRMETLVARLKAWSGVAEGGGGSL
jgi:UDP-N-acetylmuramoyl-tripeptide--D-alanyl-D-alanine ligase